MELSLHERWSLWKETEKRERERARESGRDRERERERETEKVSFNFNSLKNICVINVTTVILNISQSKHSTGFSEEQLMFITTHLYKGT